MTSGPDPDNPSVRIHYIYDAWNRLVKVYTDDSGEPDDLIATYEYDAQNRRIVKGVDDNSDGFLDTFTHYFLNSGNQVIETRTGDDISGQGPTADSLNPTYQNIWSHRYIDALILRDEYISGVLQTANRLYYLSDANHNVTALVNTSGAVLERYTYTPYGKVTIYDDTWTNTRSTSSYNNLTLYTGRTLDIETGLMYYRARYYDTSLGRFISRDPIGYDGSPWNLYAYVHGNPLVALDPYGMADLDLSLTFDEDWKTGAADFWNGLFSNGKITINARNPDWETANDELNAEISGNNRIDNLIIAGHGSSGSVGPLGAGEEGDFTDPSSPGYSFLRNLKSKTHKGSHVDIRACYVAKGQKGQNYIKALAVFLGCRVTAIDDMYAGSPYGTEYTAYPDGTIKVTNRYGAYKDSWLCCILGGSKKDTSDGKDDNDKKTKPDKPKPKPDKPCKQKPDKRYPRPKY